MVLNKSDAGKKAQNFLKINWKKALKIYEKKRKKIQEEEKNNSTKKGNFS